MLIEKPAIAGGQTPMSVQFGRLNFDGKPFDPKDLEEVRPVLAPYGPDGEGYICKDNLGILYRAFYTTRESRREVQPHVVDSGAVLTWDGQLDNRDELIGQLRGDLSTRSTDLEIVAEAYERWKIRAFPRLIGDWALSIWDKQSQSLILSKDPIGTRQLYYRLDDKTVTWSTILDPLVLFAQRRFSLCEQYIAGCLSFFPATHLTPYVGIQSVPASSFVTVRSGRTTIEKYWDFDPEHCIRYQSDEDYEEHFRTVFAEAVRRRLRTDKPVLAELSGGIDSSAIVCVADTLIGTESGTTPRLDTVSYYDDSEPNWNERPYFVKVEEKRGRTGCHIDVGVRDHPLIGSNHERFVATLAAMTGRTSAISQFDTLLLSQGYRIVLSGTGGDEVLGGIPTPIPELSDLAARADLTALPSRLFSWALAVRKPLVHILLETVGQFLPPMLAREHKITREAPWLNSAFEARHRNALKGYPSRLRVFGPRPSFQENLNALEALRRQIAFLALSCSPTYMRRYPYLDRDLLQFIYGLPREQLVRPFERRSLMRRALGQIVPAEILGRRRKGFVTRGPREALLKEWRALLDHDRELITNSIGIINQECFALSIDKARRGREIPEMMMLRTLALEGWLRHLRARNVIEWPSIRTRGPRFGRFNFWQQPIKNRTQY
jgi:asparagine synthase (glutamine-hydrolysing)